jgi:hypothetical protein
MILILPSPKLYWDLEALPTFDYFSWAAYLRKEINFFFFLVALLKPQGRPFKLASKVFVQRYMGSNLESFFTQILCFIQVQSLQMM